MSAYSLQLFSRPDCTLCDEALILLQQLGLADQVEIVDIEPDLNLLRRYGDKVPVLRWADARELHWPFDLAAIQQQLNMVKNAGQ